MISVGCNYLPLPFIHFQRLDTFQANKVNTIAVDTLAPYVATSSAVKILTVCNVYILHVFGVNFNKPPHFIVEARCEKQMYFYVFSTKARPIGDKFAMSFKFACHWITCHISKRYGHSNAHCRGFGTSQDVMINRLCRYEFGPQVTRVTSQRNLRAVLLRLMTSQLKDIVNDTQK